MKQFPNRIAILGVGLIGGSIALGLKKHFGPKITIFGSCASIKRAQIAKEMGIIDIAIGAKSQLPKDIRLVIVATPIRTILKILKSHAVSIPKNTLLIDVGSTKKTIIEEAQNLLPRKLSFIGTHPMAGSEMSGFENASVNLFRNKPWIICKAKATKHADLSIVEQLISILGAKPVLMNPDNHDELTTWASHIFLVTTSMLVKNVSRQKKWREIAEIASTGFRDSTRLASDNPVMKRDLVFTNKKNIVKALKNFKNEIDIFLQLLDKNKKAGVREYFENAKNIRDGWIANYFS